LIKGGTLYAYEIKWSARKKVKLPKGFQKAYLRDKFNLVTPENYLKWVTGKGMNQVKNGGCDQRR
jgi:hypothetical protein